MMESDEGGQGGGPVAMLRVFKQGNTVASRKQVGSQPAHATQAGRQGPSSEVEAHGRWCIHVWLVLWWWQVEPVIRELLQSLAAP